VKEDLNKTFLMWLGILSVAEKYDFSPIKTISQSFQSRQQ
jgi:hypothetical protein